MKSQHVQLEQQILLWALIGPMIALATLLVILFYGQSYAHYLSWILTIGVALCWKWQLRGMAGACLLLVLTTTYQFPQIPYGAQLWIVGLCAAITMTYMITALSYAEITGTVRGIERESSSRLTSLLQLDEKLEGIQKRFVTDTEVMGENLIQKEQELERCQKLIQVLNGELEESEKAQTNLIQEISTLKTSQPTDKESRRLEGMYQQLKEQFAEKQQVLDETRQTLFIAQEEIEKVERSKAEQENDVTPFERQLQKQLEVTEKEREEELRAAHSEVEELYSLLDRLM